MIHNSECKVSKKVPDFISFLAGTVFCVLFAGTVKIFRMLGHQDNTEISRKFIKYQYKLPNGRSSSENIILNRSYCGEHVSFLKYLSPQYINQAWVLLSGVAFSISLLLKVCVYFLAQEVIEPSNPPQGKSLAWLEVFQFDSKKQDLLHCIKIEKFAGNIQSASLATRKLLQPSWCALAPRITTINCTILALLMLQAVVMLTPGTGRRTMNRTALAPISSITWQIYRAKWMQWNLKMNKLVQVHLWEHPQLFGSWLNFQHLLFWRRNCISSRKYKQCLFLLIIKFIAMLTEFVFVRHGVRWNPKSHVFWSACNTHHHKSEWPYQWGCRVI